MGNREYSRETLRCSLRWNRYGSTPKIFRETASHCRFAAAATRAAASQIKLTKLFASFAAEKEFHRFILTLTLSRIDCSPPIPYPGEWNLIFYKREHLTMGRETCTRYFMRLRFFFLSVFTLFNTNQSISMASRPPVHTYVTTQGSWIWWRSFHSKEFWCQIHFMCTVQERAIYSNPLCRPGIYLSAPTGIFEF